MGQFESAHTQFVTFTEKRRVTVNILIRLVIVGVLTWSIVAHASSTSAWGTAIYAVLDLFIFGLAVGLAVRFVMELRSGPAG